MKKRTKQPARQRVFLGVSAALVTCLIGAGWQIATRFGVSTSLMPIDLALLRYAIPGLVLAPLWISTGLLPANVGRHLILLMVAGAGLPFGLLVMTGAQYAPVAHMAVFLPGATPLFVALLATLVLQEKIGMLRVSGFVVILIGIIAIGWTSISNMSLGTWRGDLLFLTAAASWGIYTVAFRKSGLSPWQAVAIINGWSLLAVVPVWFWLQTGTIVNAQTFDLAVQILWQGVLAGLFGLWIFGYAISAIGATNAAGIGALVPALSGIGGWFFLGESLSPLTVLGIATVTLGVLAVTGPVGAKRWKTQ